jgi:hypothetical protein
MQDPVWYMYMYMGQCAAEREVVTKQRSAFSVPKEGVASGCVVASEPTLARPVLLLLLRLRHTVSEMEVHWTWNGHGHGPP